MATVRFMLNNAFWDARILWMPRHKKNLRNPLIYVSIFEVNTSVLAVETNRVFTAILKCKIFAKNKTIIKGVNGR